MSTEESVSASASERVSEPEAMQRALDLAWRGWGRVAPNPLVGAVVLQAGRVVGEGWHAEDGGPHPGGGGPQAGRAAARGAPAAVPPRARAPPRTTPPV